MEVAVVVMAGGSGERLWPLSRRDKPKQFLSFFGDASLLQQAFARARRLASPSKIYIVGGQAYRLLIENQVPNLPKDNFIFEPVGRDTAPCIALAAACINAVSPQAIMVVLPADHVITDEAALVGTLQQAIEVADTSGGLVTIGLKPTRPETGYGYILVGEAPGGDTPARPVGKFTEKPSLELAAEYLASGRYLWNSGMFVWRVSTIRQAVEEHLPELAAGIKTIEKTIGRQDFQAALESHFPLLPKISIDYGVMEKAGNAWVVPADLGWDDLGSWTALERVLAPDADGNRITGPTLLVDTRNTIVSANAPGRLVTAFGLEDTVIVDTADAVLVASKERATDLKGVLAELRERGLNRYQDISPPESKNVAAAGLCDALACCCRMVEKPWGREIWWAVTERYAGKILQIKAGNSLSLQYHEKKHETLLFMDGQGYLEMGGRREVVRPPRVVGIPPGTVHRFEAITDMILLEVSTAELDDVVRLKDDYGRAPAAGSREVTE